MANAIAPATHRVLDRQPNRREISAISRLLATALANDPLQRWLFPNERLRLAASERLFRRLVAPRIAPGLVSVSRTYQGQLASVAVWTPPYPPAPNRWERLAESLAMRLAHGRRIHEVRQGFTDLAERHPQQPYWYLLALATTESERGQGHAAGLLKSKIEECDATGRKIALETSLPGNISYYEHFGFQIENEVDLKDGPTVWLMCRESRST